MESLFNDKAISSEGLVFRRDFIDDDDDDHAAFASEYGSKKAPVCYDAEKFDARFPSLSTPMLNSSRGHLTVKRLAGNDPGHRARVARELIDIEGEKVTSPFSF
ncbi:MAG: hypothetical protein NTY59_15235 [Alphaproteobacteria bacterium]|nr:hypothetical protein [Alphaproteobacteria bacterium]